MRLLRFVPTVLLVCLIPKTAWAWGPAAHLDFSLTVLRELALLTPAMAALLGQFRDDFLYGSLAADITIGKNLSPYQLHCHNWQVALSVLDLAPDRATRAFAWGYLTHLAADVVAHNYFVPYKTVEHYKRRGASHTYWELRFDAHLPQQVWQEGKRLSTRAFKTHDIHLRKILTGPLFPFRVNKEIFNSVVHFTRILRWRKIVEAHAKRTPRVLTQEEFAEARSLSLRSVFDLLELYHQADCFQADPTGHRNLLIAQELRRRLRQLRRQGLLQQPDLVGEQFRPIFRESIESKLVLPPLSELIGTKDQPLNVSRLASILAKIKKQAHKATKKVVRKSKPKKDAEKKRTKAKKFAVSKRAKKATKKKTSKKREQVSIGKELDQSVQDS